MAVKPQQAGTQPNVETLDPAAALQAANGALPGGGADVWTFVTYALIHANWMHLGVNAVWLLPFGSAVARRFGALRFVVFFAVTAAAGAALHLAAHAGEQFPMIGASAAISGTMAAAMRFAFQRGGPLGLIGRADASAYRVPAIPLRGSSRRCSTRMYWRS